MLTVCGDSFFTDWEFSVGRRSLSLLGAAFFLSWEDFPSCDATSAVEMRFDCIKGLVGLCRIE